VGEYTDAKEAMDAAMTALKNAKGEARKQPQQEYNAARTREADARAKVAKLEATDELRKVAECERKRMEPLSTPALQQREREYRERLLKRLQPGQVHTRHRAHPQEPDAEIDNRRKRGAVHPLLIT